MSMPAINWDSDDGVSLTMINDVPRNLFYDKILSTTVRGKKCCEIGFGTGFLSLLALKHGADSIIAYEKDPVRFALGQQVVDRLGLAHVIELRNELAQTDQIESLGCDVVFHEIIHQGLWGEGAWWIKPNKSGPEYIPGNYFFEMYATEIADSTVDGFLNGGNSQDYFNPGIEISTEFIDLINNLALGDDTRKLKPLVDQDKLVRANWNTIHKHWAGNVRHVFKSYPKIKVCSYNVDYNARLATFEDSNGTREVPLDSAQLCEMFIDTGPWSSTNMMLEFKFGLQHGQQRLYLEDCRSWGAEAPRIYIKPRSNLLFVQDFGGYNFKLQPV